MKIYHKFFLYQNKLLQPYVRLLLRLMAIITYLASIMLIVGVIYEHRSLHMKLRKYIFSIRRSGLYS